jgi:RNA polymerase sigma-70 factor (ECF subfamily)
MPQDAHFLTTRWTQVLAAKGDSTRAASALGDLCAAYYAPVHAYIAGTSHDLGDPQDLTQQFFARLLGGEGGGLGGADRNKGRFRAYLLGAVKHFLADTRDRLNADRRGAQYEHVPLGTGSDTSPVVECPASETVAADVIFDRQWGVALLARALAELEEEHGAQGKDEQFQALKPWLTGDSCGVHQADAAAQLGCSEGAVKVAIHRLRKRFREMVKAEISQTVSSEAEVREELRYLIEVVR